MRDALLAGTQNAPSARQNAPSTDERLTRLREALMKSELVITGIGSRETPEEEMGLLTKVGAAVEARNGRGRTGGAGGADLAFERGFKDPRNVDVIVPWKGFLPKGWTQRDVNNFLGRDRIESGPGAPVMLSWDKAREAENMAEKYHPAWDKCSRGARALHSRNMPQVLGLQLNKPTDAIVCWTVDGKATGGTGQALRIGADLNIPIGNLKNADERQVVLEVFGIKDPAIERNMARQAQMQMQGQGYGR